MQLIWLRRLRKKANGLKVPVYVNVLQIITAYFFFFVFFFFYRWRTSLESQLLSQNANNGNNFCNSRSLQLIREMLKKNPLPMYYYVVNRETLLANE